MLPIFAVEFFGNKPFDKLIGLFTVSLEFVLRAAHRDRAKILAG